MTEIILNNSSFLILFFQKPEKENTGIWLFGNTKNATLKLTMNG